jgi:hypothetical protein
MDRSNNIDVASIRLWLSKSLASVIIELLVHGLDEPMQFASLLNHTKERARH